MALPTEADLTCVREAVGKLVSGEQLQDFDISDFSLLWRQTEKALRASSRELLMAIGLPGALIDYMKPAAGSSTNSFHMDRLDRKMKSKTQPLAARIKRLMQKDEDVGKIAQATPVLISRALELFIKKLVCGSTAIAGDRAARLLTTSHLKAFVMSEEIMDFLKDTVASAPDLGPKDEAAAKPKRKRADGEAGGARASKARKQAGSGDGPEREPAEGGEGQDAPARPPRGGGGGGRGRGRGRGSRVKPEGKQERPDEDPQDQDCQHGTQRRQAATDTTAAAPSGEGGTIHDEHVKAEPPARPAEPKPEELYSTAAARPGDPLKLQQREVAGPWAEGGADPGDPAAAAAALADPAAAALADPAAAAAYYAALCSNSRDPVVRQAAAQAAVQALLGIAYPGASLLPGPTAAAAVARDLASGVQQLAGAGALAVGPRQPTFDPANPPFDLQDPASVMRYYQSLCGQMPPPPMAPLLQQRQLGQFPNGAPADPATLHLLAQMLAGQPAAQSPPVPLFAQAAATMPQQQAMVQQLLLQQAQQLPQQQVSQQAYADPASQQQLPPWVQHAPAAERQEDTMQGWQHEDEGAAVATSRAAHDEQARAGVRREDAAGPPANLPTARVGAEPADLAIALSEPDTAPEGQHPEAQQDHALSGQDGKEGHGGQGGSAWLHAQQDGEQAAGGEQAVELPEPGAFAGNVPPEYGLPDRLAAAQDAEEDDYDAE